MNPYEAFIRAYILTPQTLEAAKRGVKNAIGAFVAVCGEELLRGNTNPYTIIGAGLAAAAGSFGVRTLYEGVYDSRRQQAGQAIDADVHTPALDAVQVGQPNGSSGPSVTA